VRLRFVSTQTLKGLWSNRAMALSVVVAHVFSSTRWGAAPPPPPPPPPPPLARPVGQVRDQWLAKLEIAVYMCPRESNAERCADGEATQKQIDAMDKELKSGEVSKYVDTYTFESKAQALANYKKQMKGSGYEDNVTEADMQVSFRIKLKDPLDYKVVTETLSGRKGVEVVNDQSENLESLLNILNKFMKVSVVLAAIMVLTALLLIPTTIRLSAMSRRDETEIMRYVGASNFFIELPFILEGVVSALLGSVLAVGGLWVAVKYFIKDWLTSAVVWLKTVGTHDVVVLAPMLVGGALIVAALASWITLRRYAKV